MQPVNSRVPQNAPRKTLRPARALALLLLRTGLWTGLILASAFYLLREGAISSFMATASRLREERAAAALRPPPETGGYLMQPAAPAQRPPDPAALIKRPPSGSAPSPRPRVKARTGQEKPRLLTGSGNWFSKVDFNRPASKAVGGSSPKRAVYAEGAVIIPTVNGRARVKPDLNSPVPVKTARKYSGFDAEAESLRLEAERREREAEETRKRLLKEQLAAGAIVLLAGIALTLVLSRAIKAWREIRKPVDRHWTLK